jgi:8-oxo-dGTP diphosphatase
MQAHAYLAVDVVIMTVDAGALLCLLVKVREGVFAGQWAFPGGLVGLGEALEEAAQRELERQTGLRHVYLEQLRTFGDPQRDPRARVVSTAYFALVRGRETVGSDPKYADVAWFPMGRLPTLAYDHSEIAAYALERLRAKVEYSNIVYGLLPPEFTLAELQDVYEVILGRGLDRRNFRKKILATKLLQPLSKLRRGAHRPAMLYRFTRRKPMMVEML